jgi:hypothetical protein
MTVFHGGFIALFEILVNGAAPAHCGKIFLTEKRPEGLMVNIRIAWVTGHCLRGL